MAIDIRQFHQTFFEESQEGLAGMEALLLELEGRLASGGAGADAASSRETLNTIFRVVHSIKGGSGTFGFGWLADFSHLVETLLDDLREERRALDRATVDLLLRSVDCLRALLDALRTGAPVDRTVIEQVSAALEDSRRALPGDDTGSVLASGWRITFRPRRELFRSGNDPLRILRELATLGELRVEAEASALPAWKDFDPESCYLGWRAELRGRVARAAVAEAFAWVADDSELEIVPLAADAPAEAIAGPHRPDAPAVVKPRGPSIRVSTLKMDALMDIVGELVITQTMLSQSAANFSPRELPRLLLGLAQLERNVRQLQESVMAIRLLPLGFVFSRLPRLVRDLGQRLGKDVELRLSGEQTELDKTVIERISDPLLHMVRNSLDHGIEPPAERRAAGKPATGVLRVHACQKGGSVYIEIEDDGRGLPYERIAARAMALGLLPPETRPTPEQIHELIFQPGLSTAAAVSDVSGRGVGLDVVRNNIRSLGGNVEVTSQPGRGTRFVIRLPLTLAILDGLGVQVGTEVYLLPMVNVVESLRLRREAVQRLPGGEEMFKLREDYLPLMRLHELLRLAPRSSEIDECIVVVVEADGWRVGMLVDDLHGQQQVVIKSLETHYRRIEGITAATILGDGTVALILDVGGLIRLAQTRAGGRREQPVVPLSLPGRDPGSAASTGCGLH